MPPDSDTGDRPAIPEQNPKNNSPRPKAKPLDVSTYDHPTRIQYANDQRSRITHLRSAGWRLDQIARAMQLTVPEIKEQLTIALDGEHPDPIDVDSVRAVELARLDRMHRAIWRDACAGDTKAIRTALEISKRRSTIAGLDKPRRIDTHHTGAVDQRVQIYLPDNGRAADSEGAIVEGEFVESRSELVSRGVEDRLITDVSERAEGRAFGEKLVRELDR